MRFSSRTAHLRLAKALALVALLCVAALQVEEASHWHKPGESVTHCLVCKSSAGTALVSLEYTVHPVSAATPERSAPASAVAIRRDTAYQPRGPPALS